MTQERPKNIDEKAPREDSGRPQSNRLDEERAALEEAGRNWTARHVADLLDLSELTVKRMARRGRLPAVKVGRTWQFPPARLRAWYAGEPAERPRQSKKKNEVRTKK